MISIPLHIVTHAPNINIDGQYPQVRMFVLNATSPTTPMRNLYIDVMNIIESLSDHFIRGNFSSRINVVGMVNGESHIIKPNHVYRNKLFYKIEHNIFGTKHYSNYPKGDYY